MNDNENKNWGFMGNERLTEWLVEEHFKNWKEEGFFLEPQESKNPRIQKYLQTASKRGFGRGRPDFIISHEEDKDFLMLVECKANKNKLESPNRDKYGEYAVDGALLYSSYLQNEFDVIALGVAGETKEELKSKSFLSLKEVRNKQPIFFTDKLLTLDEFRKTYILSDAARDNRYDLLLAYNTELNETLHKYKVPENLRAMLISAILIALEHNVFKKDFKDYKKAEELSEALVRTVINELKKSNIQNSKIETLEHAYSFIRTNQSLNQDVNVLISLIEGARDRILSFAKTYKYYDIMGDFYTEFLRYANSDKGLGIVLTPHHITELFCDIAQVNKDSVVFDNCCGTGGFLVSAMRKMIKDAGNDLQKVKEIKEKQIIGIEFQDTLFPLVCSNMIIHDDGKTNIINGDCLKVDISELKLREKPNVGLLNPPYKSKKEDIYEFNFILNNLSSLSKGGICIALIPMSCVLAQKGEEMEFKKDILKNHTLEAVMSLPNDLFHNSKVGVVTCAIVLKAHQPHPESKKTYFGYWKEDGFVKRKNKGRINGGNWKDIKKQWLESYENKESLAGLSIMQKVTPEDEWCAEAYMETDYSKLTQEDFEKTLKDYVAFQFLHGKNKNDES